MLVIVVNKLGGLHEAAAIWDRLPPGHSNPLAPPYTIWFVLTFLVLNFLSYNGGTWNLATRFIAQSSEKNAKKSVRLSALLYLIWPFILFYPMWCCPLLFPGLENPEQSYAIMARELLPAGLVGLVLASMFANTLTMTSSDSNTITAVLSRDVIPVIFRGKVGNNRVPLRIARIISFTFILVTIIIALNASTFGGVLGLIISWFAALLGPVAIPMVLGILPVFNKMDYRAALAAIGTGFITFVVTKSLVTIPLAAEIGSPVAVAFISYCLWGLLFSGRTLKKKNHV
jgi:Na+/proline symporter